MSLAIVDGRHHATYSRHLGKEGMILAHADINTRQKFEAQLSNQYTSRRDGLRIGIDFDAQPSSGRVAAIVGGSTGFFGSPANFMVIYGAKGC